MLVVQHEDKALDTPFAVAVVQAAPVFMDREATLDKACELVLEAGKGGARLVAFPESFLPCYPDWVWAVPAGEDGVLNELYTEFLANAVTIPGDSLDKLCRIARRAKTAVVLGVSERNVDASGASLYSTLVFIDTQGRIMGKHRKLVPTAGERLVWAQGDGSTLQVHSTRLGRVGGLIGWENYMPLARYALYASGLQMHVAGTWDRSEPWLSTLRHLAKEGRMFVLSPSMVSRKVDIPDRYRFKRQFYGEIGEWINAGGSAIVNPDGRCIAGPLSMKEEILYAEIDPGQFRGPKWNLDVAGHHARPDVFRLFVNRQPHEPVVREGPSTRFGFFATGQDSWCGI